MLWHSRYLPFVFRIAPVASRWLFVRTRVQVLNAPAQLRTKEAVAKGRNTVTVLIQPLRKGLCFVMVKVEGKK